VAVVIPGFADVLNGLVASRLGGGDAAPETRAPLIFTSLYRQAIANDSFNSRFSPDGTITSNKLVRQAFAHVTPPTGLMTYITMALNPNSIRFSQPKRFSKVDTQEGSVFFHFTNSKGQNNDILTISFRGNTGNIDLRGSLGDPERDPFALVSGTAVDKQLLVGQDTGALRKLLVWHNLYRLTREPMLIGPGIENVFTVTYQSALFPVAIDFHGFFNQVLDYTEDGQKPNSRNYEFEFTVTHTSPDLDDFLAEVSETLQTAVMNPQEFIQE
jgi:hypothetical protein